MTIANVDVIVDRHYLRLAKHAWWMWMLSKRRHEVWSWGQSETRLRSDSGDEQEMCRNIDDVLKFFEILGPANSIKKMGDEQQQQKDDDPDGGEEEREKTEVEKAAEEKIVACFEANMKGEAMEGCDDDAIAVLTKVAMSVSNL